MSIGARITSVLLVVFAALVQVTIMPRIEIGSATPDVLVLVVSAIALLTGSISGAAHGFLAGICIAMFAAIPLGPHALVGVLIGYSIGRVGEALVTDEHPLPPLFAGVFATLVMELGQPLVAFLVDPTVGSIDGLLEDAILVTIISSVLALPIYLLVRRALIAANAIAPIEGGVGAG